MEYIDVRGIWPIYIHGMNTVTLVGAPHKITVEEGRIWLIVQNWFA